MGKGNKLKFILIIISIILTLTGVVLFATIQDNNELKENTVIEIDEATTKTLKAEIDGLYPGKTEEYVISFTGDNIKDYLITLDFNGDNDGTLKNFIEVEIKTNESSINKTLNELLEGNLISLGTGVTEITISYTMPIEVGNEAQGVSVVFYIELEVKTIEG
ncbi:MAG: hypothetical protein J6Q58_04030 [Clostridia bacterium]|nr:hypothetical protein [Clostridia bacterium]